MPVYPKDAAAGEAGLPGPHPRGFVAGFFLVGDIMERGLEYLRSYSVDVLAYDLDAGPDEEFLYLHWSRRRGAPDGPLDRILGRAQATAAGYDTVLSICTLDRRPRSRPFG